MKVSQFIPWVGEEEYVGIRSCFDINWLTEGPKTKEFGDKLLDLTGAKYGVFAPNGTLALYLGLRAIGVGHGDEVIVPDFTFIGSATAVEMTGATPIFVDVNRRNFQIDVESVSAVINAKTKAIMPVHIYGTAVNMDRLMALAHKHKLRVIEDAAQAIAVHYKGRHAGTFGDVGTFSFFADKTLTTAEGGFVITNDSKIYDRLRYLRNQGRIERGTFIHPRIGYNFRMTDLQAAVGLVQLAKLPRIIERKREIKEYYKHRLRGLEQLSFFAAEDGADWIPFRVGILAEKARAIMDHLSRKEIESRTFFYPLHKQPCFSYLAKEERRYSDASFPNAMFGYDRGICLPSYPTIEEEKLDYVCSALESFFE